MVFFGFTTKMPCCISQCQGLTSGSSLQFQPLVNVFLGWQLKSLRPCHSYRRPGLHSKILVFDLAQPWLVFGDWTSTCMISLISLCMCVYMYVFLCLYISWIEKESLSSWLISSFEPFDIYIANTLQSISLLLSSNCHHHCDLWDRPFYFLPLLLGMIIQYLTFCALA